VALRHEATYRSDSRRTLAASLAQAGRFEEACREAKLFMSLNPGFRVSHWIEFTRFADKAAGQHFVDGYRKAGLPE
jgi:adenylate cyclase